MNRDLNPSSNAVRGSNGIRDYLTRATAWVHKWLGGKHMPALMSTTLEQSFARLQEDLTSRMDLSIFVTGQPKALRPQIQEQVYMMGREAIINGLQHSHASCIEAEVEYLPSRLRVIVRDDGCGMDPTEVTFRSDRHRGLCEMSQRAASIGAQLRIWSRRGGGTEVEISVPGHIARSKAGNATLHRNSSSQVKSSAA